jgi:integrase
MHHDGAGLYLQVREGAKGLNRSWLYRYSLAGRDRFMGLGPYPRIGASDARKRATAARALRDQGVDPLADKRRRRAELVVSAAPIAKAEVLTFDQCVEAFIKAHGAKWSAKHKAAWETTLATYASPVIGKLPVADVDQAAVLRVLEPLWDDKYVTASRLRGRIAKVVGWSMAKGHRPKGPNPAAWADNLEHLLPEAVNDPEHHPALDYKQAPEFMATLCQDTRPVALMLQWVILTAARADEARLARWSEVDENARLWVVPAERMKGDRKHQVPLSESACAVLRALRGDRTPEASDYIFANAVGRPLAANGMLRTLKALAPDATVHGLRSTFRDWCGDETDTARETAEAALAHKVGDLAEQAYRRGTAVDKRRALMEAWAAYLQGVDVIPFRRTA